MMSPQSAPPPTGYPLAFIAESPLFGRTEILIRDPQLSFDGRC